MLVREVALDAPLTNDRNEAEDQRGDCRSIHHRIDSSATALMRTQMVAVAINKVREK
jgi:hypothetical protein